MFHLLSKDTLHKDLEKNREEKKPIPFRIQTQDLLLYRSGSKKLHVSNETFQGQSAINCSTSLPA